MLRKSIALIVIVAAVIQVGILTVLNLSEIKRPSLHTAWGKVPYHDNTMRLYGDSIFICDYNKRLALKKDKNTGITRHKFFDESGIRDAAAKGKYDYMLIKNDTLRIKVYENNEFQNEYNFLEFSNPKYMVMAENNIVVLADKNQVFSLIEENGKILDVVSRDMAVKDDEKLMNLGLLADGRIYFIGNKGNVYITDEKFSGVDIYKIPYIKYRKDIMGSVSLAMGLGGNYYVSDPLNSRVIIFDKDFNLRGYFYGDKERKNRFISASYLVSDEEKLYVSNYSVFIFLHSDVLNE